ncbi:fatty acid desaturase family protein [Mesorhizobium sp. DCY119]|uniref:fatty acid desaturase family protein n=1 Tax=Mesorhizobium sp. DCY119 TaxID=2108445 RepID=UPI000E713F1F|nr:fatty acid desaturase family protein [Mesorhizobium sp. DCY119]RJG40560.1 fatty acid desaturase [Mesorhizobium sp. DCY119]
MNTMPTQRNYSLIGRDARLAVENGLSAAEWYHTDIPRKQMKELMKRVDGPAIRDTALWFGLLALTALGGIWFWGSWAAVPFFICYGVLYGSASDSRWHECGHGTAFKTRWMNDAVYQIACFMIMREPTIWRWSHTRHHTDTIIVGRDPEIVAMRPPDIVSMLLNIFALKNVPTAFAKLLLHGTGRLTEEEKTFVPEMEQARVYAVARIWVAIHLCVLALALYFGSWLPLMLVGPLPSMYGGWFSHFVGMTQHAGLAENVLDHRLNSRTVYMNPVFRFLYWNMNYHVEHHMFPMVPYHALPQLHEIMKQDTPRPYAGCWEAYREIIPALIRQRREPEWFVRRELPQTAKAYRPEFHGEIVTAAAE